MVQVDEVKNLPLRRPVVAVLVLQEKQREEQNVFLLSVYLKAACSSGHSV